MKTIKSLILVFALSATFAFGGDGHTSGGNRCETCPPPCTENCGGFAADEPGAVSETATEVQGEETSLIDYWSAIVFELIG